VLIEIHMIQNHTPSNLNRDDLGAPKTCMFGGVTRARISSQCLKRRIRNPGNPDDRHKADAGIFAQEMPDYIGIKTRFFPWLVELELKKTGLPENEQRAIVEAARRIASSKDKDDKRRDVGTGADPRPKTPQLIHLGPGHARFFVEKLVALRSGAKDEYDYFLNPAVGFQDMVREYLADSVLPEKDRDKAVKASWIIVKCRMKGILDPTDEAAHETDFGEAGGQPDEEHARFIAERLMHLYAYYPERFKILTQKANKKETQQIKDAAPDKPKDIKAFMASLRCVNRYDGVDIALFGRMTTSEAFQDVAAAMQVAHAISTHAVVNEVDYFTAVDDRGKAGGGAGHVNEAMFNSACFYKYFSLDWNQLMYNLAGPVPLAEEGAEALRKWEEEIRPAATRLAACVLGHFLRAVALTTPSGKQNSFASHCEPCGILVEIKKDARMPTSYANAFAEPVERIGRSEDDDADEKSLEGRSVACLADHVQSLRRAYGINSKLFWYSPKLWRFPLRRWERMPDGKRKQAVLVEAERHDILVGDYASDDSPSGLVAAVVREVSGLRWDQVRNEGKAAKRADV
jgi:hypothetical protein